MKPEWDKIGHMFHESPNIFIGEVDCTKEGELCNTQNIHGYPKIRFYYKGDMKEMKSYHDFNSLLQFVMDCKH
jgi:hypothetical protein